MNRLYVMIFICISVPVNGGEWQARSKNLRFFPGRIP